MRTVRDLLGEGAGENPTAVVEMGLDYIEPEVKRIRGMLDKYKTDTVKNHPQLVAAKKAILALGDSVKAIAKNVDRV
jgi:hypothetical protein